MNFDSGRVTENIFIVPGAAVLSILHMNDIGYKTCVSLSVQCFESRMPSYCCTVVMW